MSERGRHQGQPLVLRGCSGRKASLIRMISSAEATSISASSRLSSSCSVVSDLAPTRRRFAFPASFEAASFDVQTPCLDHWRAVCPAATALGEEAAGCAARGSMCGDPRHHPCDPKRNGAPGAPGRRGAHNAHSIRLLRWSAIGAVDGVFDALAIDSAAIFNFWLPVPRDGERWPPDGGTHCSSGALVMQR